MARPKEEITVYDIYRAFEPELSIIHCVDKPVTCFISQICVASEYWMDLNDTITKHMKDETLETIVKKHISVKKRIDKAKAVSHCK